MMIDWWYDEGIGADDDDDDAYNDDYDEDIIGLVQDLTGDSDQGFAAHPKEGELEINFHCEEQPGDDDQGDDDDKLGN